MHLPIVSSHPTNKPTGTKRYECCGVRAFLDGMADIILSTHRALANHLGCIRGSLFRLAIEILSRTCCLIDNPFNLVFGVAGDAAKTFLRFAAEISCSTDYAIFIHWRYLVVCCPRCFPSTPSLRDSLSTRRSSLMAAAR